MRSLSRYTLCLFFVAMVLGFAQGAFAQRANPDLTPLQEAMKKGDYTMAKQLSLQYDDAPSMLVRVELAQMQGDLVEALRLAKVAAQVKSTTTEQRRALETKLAQIERLRGQLGAAETRLRDLLKRDPKAYGARLELGLLLWDQGNRKEAVPLLDELGNLFNNGLIRTAEDYVTVGLAMKRLGNFEDANYAFERAHDVDKTYQRGLIEWGYLFLEKYNIKDAVKSFEEVLAVNPSHPRALVGRAFSEMGRMSLHDDSRKKIAKAQKHAPNHAELLMAKVVLALANNEMSQARQYANEILKQQPLHLDALTTFVTADYLQDRKDDFEVSLKRVLKVNPKYSKVLTDTADWSLRRFRYVEAMALYERALKIDPKDSGALFGLGLGYSRLNRENEAVNYLQRAYEEDPFNMRLVYLLNLYEQEMSNFTFIEHDGFRIRAHNKEFELVDMYVTPIVKQARDVFSKKYNHTPEDDLSVEVYHQPDVFSIRSVGVPMISASGVCFGKLVTVHSPSMGRSNWRQVVWHEMAHVFHLQLSKFRTPRWFTEGLAEYETNVWDEAWQRYHQRDVALKVFGSNVPSVVHLDRGFTHAKNVQETVRAYYLASLAIHFIAQTWGFDQVVAMLKGYAKYDGTQGVVENVLKVSVTEFDTKFTAWLQNYLRDFDAQYLVDLSELPKLEEVNKKLKLNPLDGEALAFKAILAQRKDDMKAADEMMKKAEGVAQGNKNPKVHYLGVVLRLMQSRPKEALAHGQKLLRHGRDSYDLRLALAKAAQNTEDLKLTYFHLHAATQLYPKGVEAWIKMFKLGQLNKDQAMMSKALARMWELAPHEASVSETFVKDRQEAKDAKGVAAGLQRWLDIAPFTQEVHEATLASAALVKDKSAISRAWLSLVLIAPREKRSEVVQKALVDFKARGMTKEAEQLQKKAEALGVGAK